MRQSVVALMTVTVVLFISTHYFPAQIDSQLRLGEEQICFDCLETRVFLSKCFLTLILRLANSFLDH